MVRQSYCLCMWIFGTVELTEWPQLLLCAFMVLTVLCSNLNVISSSLRAPRADLESSCPSAGPVSTALVRGSSLCCPCPSFRWTTTHAATVHAADRHARTGRPGGWRGSDFNVLRRWVIPVWRRRCPRESWHVALCLCEIIASVKLVYSHKTFWCWLPHECANQHGSFVKLRLLSNQWRNRHIVGGVKMKRYCQPVAALQQDTRGVAQIRAYALAVTLAQVTWSQFQVGEIRVQFRVENWSFEYTNRPITIIGKTADNRPIPIIG